MDLSQGNNFPVSSLKLKKEEKEDLKFKLFNKKYFYISDEDKEMPYQNNKILVNVHWGQLKLFCSEFASMIYHLNHSRVSDIVYIGAAPGDHIYVLAQLYEDFTYHLYDSEKFDSRLKELSNVKIYSKYFDDVDLNHWSDKSKIFLISDIRTLSYDSSGFDEKTQRRNEDSVWSDMQLQRRWVETLEPELSLLKFRLPFAHDFILEEGKERKYLEGLVMRQVYNKPTSSETRLLVSNIEHKDWNLISYERKLAYHNCRIRTLNFLNPITNNEEKIYKSKGLFNDFDSTYLCTLVMDFLISVEEVPNTENVTNMLDFILNNISSKKSNLLSKRAGF